VEASARDPAPADERPGPFRLAPASEAATAIEKALACLRHEDRAVVLMREVEGLAYEEIARALGLPLGTLKARLHRARERLRRELLAAGVTP
jgi:RNA polymerase sigma-70 factor (ECF subfamily)